MRIKIFHILKQDDQLQEGFMNVLHKAFEACNIEEAKGEDYDLIHVIGIPTKEMTRMIRQTKKKLIPIIYSPLAEIVPWNKARVEPSLAKNLVFLTTGKTEYTYIQEKYPQAHVHLIKNPLITTATTQTLFNNELVQLYHMVIAQHDEHIREAIEKRIDKLKNKIEDKTIHNVLKGFLYLNYKYKRRQILQKDIDEQSLLMQSSDYDEDKMSDLLVECKLFAFVSSLESVMEEKSSLTEGFMPIPAKDNHLTKKINTTMI